MNSTYLVGLVQLALFGWVAWSMYPAAPGISLMAVLAAQATVMRLPVVVLPLSVLIVLSAAIGGHWLQAAIVGMFVAIFMIAIAVAEEKTAQ